MSQRLRFLLDTNILIPLQDSYQVLDRNLANFVRLANIGGHQLLYHPATIDDFQRDKDPQQKARNLERIHQYSAIETPAACPWNTDITSPNDACDNEILYSLKCDAVHALVTEDRGIHRKAKAKGLHERVYTIQTAEDWLRRLHEPRQVILPNIQDVPLHSLTPLLSGPFFDSLRDGYPGFDEWFRGKARENRMAWVYRDGNETLSAICIYATQSDEVINDAHERLSGLALKLCTFKVGNEVRGRKIGELFLKAAFRYATENACEHVFIHANAEHHEYLIQLLQDFGFEECGSYNGDLVLVKSHPVTPPDVNLYSPLDYVRKYFPHYRYDESIQKFLIPIQPNFHEVLFPDYRPIQSNLFSTSSNIGNAIKLAYLCHAQTRAINVGDLILFYRTNDEKSITSIGVVDRFEMLDNAASIASIVSRRTVYTIEQIDEMATRPTKVILFRLVEHLPNPVSYDCLQSECKVRGRIQSIRKITHESFSRILTAAGR